MIELNARRSGKSVIVRLMIEEALERGEVLDVCSIKPEGGIHVCRVQHIKTARSRA